MLSVKIANKLEELYCSKAEYVIDKLNQDQYGINCDNNEFPQDGELRIMLLEYINQFKGDTLTTKLESFPCLKKIIYE